MRFAAKLAIASALVMVSSPVSADESVNAQLRSCAQIQNALERLVCFDNVVAGLGSGGATAQERGRGQGQGQGQARSEQARQQMAPEERAREAEARAQAAEQRAAEAEARAQQAEQRRQEQAGSSSKPIDGREYVNIAEAWQDPRGTWFFRLDNGQVWRQQGSERFFFSESTQYYIEEGRVFNSYFLGTDGQNRRLRVQLDR